jgi:hypothetical protein
MKRKERNEKVTPVTIVFSYIYIYICWVYGVYARNAPAQIVHGGAVPRDATQAAVHPKCPTNINGPQQTVQQLPPAAEPLKLF